MGIYTPTGVLLKVKTVYMTAKKKSPTLRKSFLFAAPGEANCRIYGLGMRIVLLVIRHP